MKNGRYLVRRVAKFEKANEFKHDQTRQRQFERRFESRDLPDSRAARADASDGGRGSADIRGFESRRNAKWYETKVREAAARLPDNLKRYRRLLWAIYRNGKKKRISKRQLGVSNWWYREGLRKLKKFFLGQ